MMINLPKNARKILSVALPLLLILSVALAAMLADRTEPENPLLQDAAAQHMLLDGGGSLQVSHLILDAENVAELYQHQLQIQQDPDLRSDVPLPEHPDEVDPEDTGETDNLADDALRPDDTTDDTSGPQTGSETDRQELSAAEDKKTESSSPDIHEDSDLIDMAGDTNPELSGTVQTPSQQETAQEYFTTDIINGEKVNTAEYTFRLWQKQKVDVFRTAEILVNGGQQRRLTDADQSIVTVELDKGQNTIRVVCTYDGRDGKPVVVYQDYTVTFDHGDIIIITDLADKTTNEQQLSFNATAAYANQTIPVRVYCNDKELDAFGKKYTAFLTQGENKIRIAAESGDKKSERSFTVVYKATESLTIYTDLYDRTVHTEKLSFTAALRKASDQAKMTVVCNGETASADRAGSETYTVLLKPGSNVIRLKAVDMVAGESITVNKSYNIKYAPEATADTKPILKYVSVTNNMTVVGKSLALEMVAADYLGERIYQDSITVVLNGATYPYSWETGYTGYMLSLNEGNNYLKITLRDKDGREGVYYYTLNSQKVAPGGKIGTIRLSIDANVLGLGYLVAPTDFDIMEGETPAETIVRFLKEKGFTYESDGSVKNGFYLERIGKPGIAANVNIPQALVDAINQDGLEWKDQRDKDSLGEFDYCQGSGWMYSVNNEFPGYGLTDALFKDGDIVRLRFTLAYGKDIGGFQSTGNSSGKNYQKGW